jgi:hypothetical protein
MHHRQLRRYLHHLHRHRHRQYLQNLLNQQ